MPDPAMYPGGSQSIKVGDVETTPTNTDLLEVFDATKTNDRKAISILNLLKNLVTAQFTATEYTVSGAISADVSYVELNGSAKLEMTIAAPAAGRLLIITQTDTGTDGHTVTCTAGDFDGTNEIATFNAAEETLVLFGISASRFVIVENIGGVALST